MKQKNYKYWFFVLPVFIPFSLCILIPAAMGIYYSFTDWNGISQEISWAGLENYKILFSGDKDFTHAFVFTLLFALCGVVLVNVIGFLLALLVTQKFKGSTLFRAVFFMPNLIGGLLLGFTWQFIFINVFDMLGKTFHMSWLQGWLSNQSTGFVGMLIVFVWQLSGYMMIIYIAGLQSIPDSLIEASYLDGAGALARLKNIILPLVAPSFTIGLFMTLSNAFKLFDTNLSLTGGNPYKSTEMIALNIYSTAFTENKLGLSQAKAVIYLIVVAIIALVQLSMNKKKEVEM